ncbi:MAG: TonB-dependent receptor [Chitinophagia bacterium]|nr:TonB-dependent receptor [Chitinophagia bacterium]
MKKLFSLLVAVCFFSLYAIAQPAMQTITGHLYDEASGAPLEGVIVMITDLEPVKGTATDSLGNFRIDSVPIGRHTVKAQYFAYEPKVLNDIDVTAGKQVNLRITMQEQIKSLKEVTVAYSRSKDKNSTNNEMAMISARSFNVDETKRYAGAIGDPSRMAANFAGIVAGNDSRNDIIVRGNSPNGMLWQLDGLNIPNPNHFGALNSTGGPVSMLNNNNIAKSDFLTGAFPAQYGNSTAAVFDIRLREGNHNKQEYVGQMGFNGFEGGIEGPIGKKKQTSYFVNYRYSTLGVFKQLGINIGTGTSVPIYQDVNYKIVTQPWKNTKIALFGINGNSHVNFLGKDVDSTKPDLYSTGDPYVNQIVKYATTINGISVEQQLNKKSNLRIVGGYTTTYEDYQEDSISTKNYEDTYGKQRAKFTTQKASIAATYIYKFNAKNNLQAGLLYDNTTFNLLNKDLVPGKPDIVYVDQTGSLGLARAYTQWKHRFNSNITTVVGLNAIYLDLNGSFALEPRANIRYTINSRNAFSLGYGLHNQAQSIYTYFVQSYTPQGIVFTNHDIGFTQSQHLIAGYDLNITQNMRIKAEAYYQMLNKVPVTSYSSSYSAMNEGTNFYPPNTDSLVNTGTAANYGAELTIEHFLTKGYYFLITTSLINSKYKGSDGIERNTAFNTQYIANVLGGKEFKIGNKGSRLGVNIKITTIGGKYLTPLDLAASAQQGKAVYDDSKAYSIKQKDYFRTDFKLYFRREMKKSTMEFSIDLQNITNNKNIFNETYDVKKNKLVTNYQQGFFPVPMFRWTF